MALVLGACGALARPTPTGPEASGAVRISVQRAAGASELFNAERRARIVTDDGTVAYDGALKDDAITTAIVPAGTYTLSTFTVFFGDFAVCASDPPGSAAPTCFAPTLRPSQVCGIVIGVTGTRPVAALFTILADGGCRLEELSVAPFASG